MCVGPTRPTKLLEHVGHVYARVVIEARQVVADHAGDVARSLGLIGHVVVVAPVVVRQVAAAVRDHDRHVGPAVEHALVNERGHHLGLLDRLPDGVPQRVLLIPRVADAVGVDERDQAQRARRLPHGKEARVAEVRVADCGGQIEHAHPELVDAALELRHRAFEVLQGQRDTADEAVRVGADELRDMVVDQAAELDVRVRIGPLGAGHNGREREHRDVDPQPVHVLEVSGWIEQLAVQAVVPASRPHRTCRAEARCDVMHPGALEHHRLEHMRVEVDDRALHGYSFPDTSRWPRPQYGTRRL